MTFVNLNSRSHFSLGESLLTPTQIAEEHALKGASRVALTDTMRISGMPEFVKACDKNKVFPIIGVRLRIVEELHKDRTLKKQFKPYFIRVIALNDAGYRAILHLLTVAYNADHFYEVPRLLLSDVASALDDAGEGAAIVTLGDFYGAHMAGNARSVVGALRAVNAPVVSEILPIPTAHFLRLAKEAFDLQAEMGVPVICGAPAFYKEVKQADSLDLMRAIAGNLKLNDRSARHVWRGFRVMDRAAMETVFSAMAIKMSARYPSEDASAWNAKFIDTFATSNEWADKAVFKWEKQPPSLPKMAADEFMAVVEMCKAGWVERFSAPVFGHVPKDLAPYKERLAYELGILRSLKFEAYFLLVANIVNWSKANGVRVGPGRGSVGGSLVAYLMGITDVDPIRFNLLFERFINPDRIDLPDADLDFMSTRREEIVNYVREKFGEEYVAGVSNYTTMLAAGALKDTCRMLGVEGDNLAFSKLVPKEHGQSISLSEAIPLVPELAKFATEHPAVVEHALNIEDRMRSYGKHAAGIIVAGVPLEQRAVVEQRKPEEGAVVNWDKAIVEDFGLVKIDVLGLSTLDMIDLTLKQIFRNHGKKIDPKDMPLDDAAVLEAFGRGETVGVFQFESGGMRRLLKDMAALGRLSFEDLTAATALYRPGPMDSGLMAQYVNIKQGKAPVSYPHPSMTDALKDTFGVIVYQEEVMQVARDFAGFTLVESDHLRKAMGKKDKDKMAAFHEKFVDGAVALHGVSPGFAAEQFGQIEKFAGYGFNKSHASAYSLISYVCMWLKVNYPAEFFAGLLTYVKEERRSAALADMKRLGITLMPPDINDSSETFECLHGAMLLAPFNSVKMVSDNATAAIMTARADGKGRFTSIADFVERVEKRKCNVRVRDNLDKVGAFSRIEPGQLPANDHTRRIDQMELMSGLIQEAVIVDRPMSIDHLSAGNLSTLINSYKTCEKCELAGLCHPKPSVRAENKFFIVLDGPNFREEAKDEMGHGNAADAIFAAMNSAGMKPNEAYITSLIKSPKPEGKRDWSNTTMAECPAWLEEEVSLLHPPLIVIMGQHALRHFCGEMKGGLNEHTGRVIYDKKRACNLLIGINPNSIYFDPSKQTTLNDVMATVVSLLPT